MDGSKNVRLPLKNANIHYIDSITRRTWKSSICQECTIEKYEDLKDNTHYSMTRDVLGRERVLKFYKTKRSHFFQLHCELRNEQIRQQHDRRPREDKMTFYIMYEKMKPVWYGDLTETEYGYSMEVPNELVLHSDNKYLHHSNNLVIEFHYRHYPHARPPIVHDGKSTKEDEEAFSNDILSLYENHSDDAEFGFITEDCKVFSIHGLICDARSDNLKYLLTDVNKCVALAYKQSITDIVLRYMYSGKLDELPLDDLIEVLAFATKIYLPSLRQSLIIALREKLNTDNALGIWKASEVFALLPLSSYAQDLMPQVDIDNDIESIQKKAILKLKLRERTRRR